MLSAFRIIIFLLTLNVFFASSALSQDDPRGLLIGRLLEGSALNPLTRASLEVVVRRGEALVSVAKGSSDGQGRFRLKVGTLYERPYLRVRAVGLAAREWPLRMMRNGQGLVLPDLVLSKGVRVSLPLSSDLSVDGPLFVRAYPLAPGERIVDLGAQALSELRLQSLQTAVFPNVAAGSYLFVVGDDRAEFRSEALVWRVGPDDVSLPPMRLRTGQRLELKLKAKTPGNLVGRFNFGAGVWHPDGGEEFRYSLPFTKKIESSGDVLFSFDHLQPSMCRGNLRIGDDVARFAHLPLAPPLDLVLRQGARLSGQLKDRNAVVGLANALVQIGTRLTTTADDGTFEFRGLFPGAHPFFLARLGRSNRWGDSIVLDDYGAVKEWNTTLDPGATIFGSVRNRKLKTMASVLVGWRRTDDEAQFMGFPVCAASDLGGKFQIRGVSAGEIEFNCKPSPDSVAISEVEHITDAAQVVVELRMGRSGRGGGLVRWADDSPAASLDVFLISSPAPRRDFYDHDLQERLAAPQVRRTVTDDKGRYHFRGLAAGRYEIVFRDDESNLMHVGAVDITFGDNRNGFDWILERRQPVFLDVPSNVAMQLRSGGHDGVLRWLFRQPGSGALRVNGLAKGRYVLSAMPATSPVLLDLDKVAPYVENQENILGRFFHPNGVAAKFADLPALAAFEVEFSLLLGGGPLGDERLEFTAYCLAGPRALAPWRFSVGGVPGPVNLQLPRGLWLLHAVHPRRGSAFLGPFDVGRQASSTSLKNMLLNVEADATVIGTVPLGSAAISSGAGTKIVASNLLAARLKPYTLFANEGFVRSDGSFRYEALPKGSALLKIESEDFWVHTTVEADALEIQDLGRLIVASKVHLGQNFPGVLSSGARLSGAAGRSDHWPRYLKALPGPRMLKVDVPVAGLATGGVSNAVVLKELLSDHDIQGPDFLAAGRASFATSIRIDNRDLECWPCELIPVHAGAFDFDRPTLRCRSDDDGKLHLHSLASGRYAFRFSYNDRRGMEYALTVALNLADGRSRLRQDLRIKTRAVKVRVVGHDDARVIRNCRVRVLKADLRGLAGSTAFRRKSVTVAEGRSDRNGELWFEKLALGVYDLVLSSSGRASLRISGLDLREAGPNRVVDCKLTRGVELALRLLDERGRGLAAQEVFLFDDKGAEVHDNRLLLSGPDGRLLLGDLKAGPLKIMTRGPLYPTQEVGMVNLQEGRLNRLEKRLDPGIPVEVTCQEESGRRIAKVRIRFEEGAPGQLLFGPQSQPLDERSSFSTAFGFFRLNRVPQGFCKIVASREGYHTTHLETQINPGHANQFLMILRRNR